MPIYLAGRKLSRAPGAGFAAALLLLLAMGLLVVSTSYRAIVLTNHEDAAHTLVGADWNIQVSPPDDVLAVDRRHAAEHDPGGPHGAGHRRGHVRAAADGARDRSGDLRRPADGGARTSPRRRSIRSWMR